MINAQSLEQILGGDDQLKKKCPKLLRLIKAENQLKMVQSLPWIIELHRFVKCYFDYSLDEHEIAKLNVDEVGLFLRYYLIFYYFIYREQGNSAEIEMAGGGNLERYVILNCLALDFLIFKIKEQEFQKTNSVALYPIITHTYTLI